ncbi:NAD-dependent deacetylase [Bacteroidota bacterium]
MEIPWELLKRLSEAEHISVLTGAGISAESGIKTFRDPDGLWTKMSPMELASAEGFMKNPELVWGWYKQRREMMASKKPNPGHYAIVEMETLFPNFTLITQNIDRLHQTAGSKYALELHGNIVDNHCMDCNEPFKDEIDPESKTPPKCKKCSGNVRPSVVWFGEILPTDILRRAQESASNCDVFFSIGTSAEVYPAADLPLIALRNGAYTIEVNPNKTVISNYMHTRLEAPSGEALPMLVDAYKKYMNE